MTQPQPGGRYRDGDGELRLGNQYDVDGYLQLTVGEIWPYGHRSPQVPGRLRRMLDDVHDAALKEHRPAIEAWRAHLGEQKRWADPTSDGRLPAAVTAWRVVSHG